MRASRIWCGLFAGLGLAAAAHGQTVPFDATISRPQVEVRSGPSEKLYATGRLRQGASVHVLKEENDWLAITPPPGSFSWISGLVLDVDRTRRTAVVHADGAPVRVGSALVDQEPTVEQVKLSRGAQVVILGTPKDGKWWPIEPPPQEVRYVPKDAVRTTPTVETVSNHPASDPNKPAGWTTPGAATSPTVQQAEEALKAGDRAKAIALYEQAGRELINTNHDLATRCQNQANFLRQGNFGSVPPGYQPGIPAHATTGADPRIAPIPSYTPGTPAPGQLAGQQQSASYSPQPATPQPLQSSGLGRLRRAGFFVDGKQAYVLENSQGRPQYYVTSQPNLNLELYVNHVVNLVGVAVYRGDLRFNYMTASGVSQVDPR